MQNVAYLIYVGSNDDLAEIAGDDSWAIVHACKTSHKAELGYEKSLPSTDPNYLVFRPIDKPEIFLNLVDMKNEFMPMYTDPIMRAAFEFIDFHVSMGKKILIHCDQGNSRGPSIAMAYLAQKGEFNNAGYADTAAAFKEKYPSFEPGDGIKAYMMNHWHRIMGF